MNTLRTRLDLIRQRTAHATEETISRDVRQAQYAVLDDFLSRNPLAKEVYDTPDSQGYNIIHRLATSKFSTHRTLPKIDPIYDRRINTWLASLRETGYAEFPVTRENELTTTGRLAYLLKENLDASRMGATLGIFITASISGLVGASLPEIKQTIPLDEKIFTFALPLAAGTLTYFLSRESVLAGITHEYEEVLDLLHDQTRNANSAIRDLKTRRERGKFL